RLFDRLGARQLCDGAVIAVVSDHGEGLNDHGESEHGIFLYREALHVPWLLRLPGDAGRGSRMHGAAGIVDVAATLLDLAGARADALDGQSELPALGRGSLPARTVTSPARHRRARAGVGRAC